MSDITELITLPTILNVFNTKSNTEFINMMLNYPQHSNLLSDLYVFTNSLRERMETRSKRSKEKFKRFTQTKFLPRLTEDREKYQFDVFARLRQIPFEYKTVYINKLQERVPFVILDPHLRALKSGERISYGIGDVMRFVGMPKIINRINKLPETENPFNARINYNVPDFELNMFMDTLYDIHNINNKIQHLKQLYAYTKQAYKTYKKKRNTSRDNAQEIQKYYLQYILNLIELLKKVSEIHYQQMSPVTWSKHVEGQERPMETYIKENIDLIATLVNTNLRQIGEQTVIATKPRVALARPVDNELLTVERAQGIKRQETELPGASEKVTELLAETKPELNI